MSGAPRGGRGTVPIGARGVAAWALLALLVLVPLVVAARSPLLEWRQPVYVAAGLAGVAAMGLMLVQPLLAMGVLPGPGPAASRRWHGRVGLALLALVGLHVAGLWVTSPPDVVDALLYASPTPFSAFGVTAMWALLAAAVLAASRRKTSPRTRRLAHLALAAIAVIGTVVHAALIEGTMGDVSKALLAAALLAATGFAAWWLRARRR